MMANTVTPFAADEGVSRANFNSRIDEINTGIEAAQSAANAAKAVTDTAGAANGLATLDENGKLAQMPKPADIGAVNKAGDIMTGSLSINKGDWGQILITTSNNDVAAFEASHNRVDMQIQEGESTADRRMLVLFDKQTNIKTALRFSDVNSGVSSNYYVHHTGNKPFGSYTGNGSATERTIDTGGIGHVVAIRSTNGTAIVTYSGAITMQEGVAGCISYNNVHCIDGNITIKTNSSFLNANGITYYYQVL